MLAPQNPNYIVRYTHSVRFSHQAFQLKYFPDSGPLPQLASGVSFPVGFKNGTDGRFVFPRVIPVPCQTDTSTFRMGIAIDAIKSSSNPHHFLGVNKHGVASITKTKGNTDGHVILRGGSSGPNYEQSYVEEVVASLRKAKISADRVMVDCSHGNSLKNHLNQPKVAECVVCFRP